MKTIITLALLLSSCIGLSQSNFYDKDGKKIPIIGEKTVLTFNDSVSIKHPSAQEVDEELAFLGTLFTNLAPSIIDLGFKISNDLIAKSLKKFTSEFSARNTYTNKDKYIGSFQIKRTIKPKDEDNKTALTIDFAPIQTDSNAFAFAITKMSTQYSGAKTKKGYNTNNYAIEIKVTYFDGKEKKEQNSVPILVELIDLGSDYIAEDELPENSIYFSDKFPLNSKYTIAEVNAKIIEVNTAKAKAEKLKSIFDTYSEDAKNIIKITVEKE